MSIPITFPTLYTLRSSSKTPSTRTAVGWATYVQGWKVRRSNPGMVKAFFTSPKRPRCPWRPSILLLNGHRYSLPGGYSCRGLAYVIHRHVAPWIRWKSSGCTLIYQQLSLSLYTECHRRNGPNFVSLFLMLNYTDITQKHLYPKLNGYGDNGQRILKF